MGNSNPSTSNGGKRHLIRIHLFWSRFKLSGCALWVLAQIESEFGKQQREMVGWEERKSALRFFSGSVFFWILPCVRQSCSEEIHRLPCVREGVYNTGEPSLHIGIPAQSLWGLWWGKQMNSFTFSGSFPVLRSKIYFTFKSILSQRRRQVGGYDDIKAKAC